MASVRRPSYPELRGQSTCPSGVQYGHLVDIGRKIVDEKVPRPALENALRWTLKEGLPSPLFGPAMKLGQSVRGLLPAKLKAKVPAPQSAVSTGKTPIARSWSPVATPSVPPERLPRSRE